MTTTGNRGNRRDGARSETIELPATAAAQRALHEAIGHLYDELAVAAERRASDREQIPGDVFEAIETLYVATAEGSVSRVEISYERTE